MKALLIFVSIIIVLNMQSCQNEQLNAPKAKIIAKADTLHGTLLVDNYYWLRERENPEVIEYLQAENEYADAIMSDTKELQGKLYDEILSSIQETDLSVPTRKDDYFYYSRTEKGKNYSIHCRKKLSLEADEEIILDENQLAEGKNYFQLANFVISPDHKLLAYSVDYSGNEQYTIYIKNLSTNELLSDKIENTYYGLEWTADSKSFYYTTLNDIMQADKVFRHNLGSQNDELIYAEQDLAFFLSLAKTKDESTILIELSSKDETEILTIDANNNSANPTLIRERENGIEYFLESHSDNFYIWTNDDAMNFKLMTAPKTSPHKENWREFIPYNEKVKINSVEPFKDYLAIHIRENGLKKLNIYNFKTKDFYFVSFPEVAYSYDSYDTPNFNDNIIRLRYTSFITPSSVYDYNLETQTMELLKETPVLGGYDRNNYAIERIFATTDDGSQIPISIVYKKGIKLDGTNPLLLYAYGSYGFSLDPYFSHSNLPLINRGFIYAIAHIRGGSEMGEIWYRNGKMLDKKNTFTDFINVAEHLVKNLYTSSDKLIIEGGSAGGLLIGAVINMRPDLFKVALMNVPFVDVINTMLDETIPLTIMEYTEWGNPNEKKYFDYMLSYSPYDNIRKQNYPHTLIRAGLYDPRVQYWEPAKFTAKMRELKTDNNLLLLKTNMDAGHSGVSGRYERIKEKAFDYAFIFKCLDIKQ